MSFKRPLSVSPSSKQINCDKIWRQSKNSTNSGLCQICGDKARIVNYGALSCHSCKIFFRRHGLHPQNIRSCLFDRSCRINKNTRRCCVDCRLAKCFSMGMSSDFIRKEEQTYKKYSLPTQVNITKHPAFKQIIFAPQLLMSNKWHKNSSLDNYEWALLSNIVHAYNTFDAMPQICRIIEWLSILPTEIQFDEKNASEIVTLIYRSMQSFVNSLPDFQVLTTNGQISLFERNLSAITVFCFVLIFSDTFINTEPKCIDLFTTIYGSEILLQAKNVHKQLFYDLTIVKVMLIVLAFSSNCFLVDVYENMINDSFLHGTHCLFGSQNIYIELLWKYMIYHHDYYYAVRCFSQLMKIFLNLIKYSTIAYRNNVTYYQLVDNVFTKLKKSVIIDQNKKVQLWGRCCNFVNT